MSVLGRSCLTLGTGISIWWDSIEARSLLPIVRRLGEVLLGLQLSWMPDYVIRHQSYGLHSCSGLPVSVHLYAYLLGKVIYE